MNNHRTALVTGASSGIGHAVVKSLAGMDWHVFAGVRKNDDATDLEDSFGDKVTPLFLDVTDQAAVTKAAATVKEKLAGRVLNGLVNNAGIAVTGPLKYIDPEKMQKQFDVNVFGVVRVTQAFLPFLAAGTPPGKIVNTGSVAGRIAYPLLGPYCMSKHALEAFSTSLRRELLIHGIDVVLVCPGAVRTPIWRKIDRTQTEQYRHTEYFHAVTGMHEKLARLEHDGMDPEKIAALVCRILTGKARRPRYTPVQKRFSGWILPRILPERITDAIMGKRTGLAKSVGNHAGPSRSGRPDG